MHRFLVIIEKAKRNYSAYHVRVERDDNKAKFWLTPVRLQFNGGFSRSEISRIEKLVEEHRDELLEGWNGFFSN